MTSPSSNDEIFADLPAWRGPAILLVDLDAFFASVEMLDHPEWRGKPLIVGGDADRHGVVSTCSYEARAYGVRSAMPSITAKRLCPDAIWAPVRHGRYKEVSKQIMAIFFDETPHVQQVSIDEAFLDISPTRINTEHPIQVARRIQRRVEEIGVTCSIGLSTSKSVSKIASDMDKPRGLTVVYPGGEQAFMSPLPIRTLSGIGASAEAALHNMGIKTLGELSSASEDSLRHVFGKNAALMRNRAAGREISKVDPDDQVKSISHEVTFSPDLTNREAIEDALASIGSKVGRRARAKGLKGRTLNLKIRYDDLSVHSVQQALDEPTNDELFYLPILFSMIDTVWREGINVRLLGVGLSGFDNQELSQPRLFEDSVNIDTRNGGMITDRARRENLLRATDNLKDRFGENSIRFGREFKNNGTSNQDK